MILTLIVGRGKNPKDKVLAEMVYSCAKTTRVRALSILQVVPEVSCNLAKINRDYLIRGH